jgi:hypothetical protein
MAPIVANLQDNEYKRPRTLQRCNDAQRRLAGMPVWCTICCHSQQASIDARLLAGENLRVLGNEYAVRAADLRHHRDDHHRDDHVLLPPRGPWCCSMTTRGHVGIRVRSADRWRPYGYKVDSRE